MSANREKEGTDRETDRHIDTLYASVSRLEIFSSLPFRAAEQHFE